MSRKVKIERGHRDPRWHETLKDARAVAKRHEDFSVWKYEFPRGKKGYYCGPCLPNSLERAATTEL